MKETTQKSATLGSNLAALSAENERMMAELVNSKLELAQLSEREVRAQAHDVILG